MRRPFWDADLQRSQLRGFARLKAVLWKRSLWLYQSACLMGTSWYWPLVKAMRKGPGPFELLSAARVKTPADIFGETPILTTVRLLQIIEAVHGQCPTPLVDLGCGRGATCLTAASLGYDAVGLEQEASWVHAACGVAEKLSLPARFEAGDLRRAAWPEQGTFLIVATAYPDELRAEILQRLQSLRHEQTLVVTVDWDLGPVGFRELWSGRLPVDWGIAQFVLWCPAVGAEI